MALVLVSDFLLMQTLGGSGDAQVVETPPYMHMIGMSSWLLAKALPGFADIWGVNQQMSVLSVCLKWKKI